MRPPLDEHLADALVAALGQPLGLALRCRNPAAVRTALFRVRKDLAAGDRSFDSLYIRICPTDRSVVWITKVPGKIGRPKT